MSELDLDEFQIDKVRAATTLLEHFLNAMSDRKANAGGGVTLSDGDWMALRLASETADDAAEKLYADYHRPAGPGAGGLAK